MRLPMAAIGAVLASNFVSAPALAQSDTSSFDIDKAFALDPSRVASCTAKSSKRF